MSENAYSQTFVAAEVSAAMRSPQRIRWYFWSAVAVLVVNLGIIGWAIFEGRVLHRYDWDPSAAPDLLDYTGMVLSLLIPSALFGLMAPIVKEPRSVRRYFVVAALIGGLFVYCAHKFLNFSHIDCFDDCVAAVPTYAALRWVALAATVPAVLVPMVLAVAPWRRS